MRFLLTCLLAGFSLTLFAQQKNCHSHSKNEEMMMNNPAFKNAQDDLEAYTLEYAKSHKAQHAQSGEKTSIRRINVVVHILYENSSEDFTDEQVIEAIDSLNNDFRGLNNDGLYNPSQAFFDLWADTEIEFALATTDPDGNSTTGITRTLTTVANFSANSENMKYTAQGGIDNWDPFHYLNVWVCTYGSQTDLGYAYYPSMLSVDPDLDGCVVNTPAFAISGVRLGRTLTHEIGHYLNLDHIFGDESGCADDGVNDTPVPDNLNFGCPTYPSNANNGCTNGTDGEGEMYMNFMDYTDDDCMSMFTMGQSTKMNAVLDGARSDLSELSSVEDKLLTEFIVFPNPSEGNLNFILPVKDIQKVELINSIGENINVIYFQNGNSFNANLQNVSAGMYTLMAYSKSQIFTSKFIVK